MCPGGTIVPATAYANTNIVNGMSLYQRNGKFANAACVAGINLNDLLQKEVSPLEALGWLEQLEHKFYNAVNGYSAPTCSIKDFINRKLNTPCSASSYPFELSNLPLWELLPERISSSMTSGLKDFCRKLKGFETGNIMGLESKTSSPIQAVREDSYLCTGFDNLYIVGEGSGYAGGIISSGVDGLKSVSLIM